MSKVIKLTAAIILLAFSAFCTVALIMTDIIYQGDLFSFGAGMASTLTMIDFFMIGVTVFAILHLIDVLRSD